MKYRALGTSGLTVSEIGFGAWGIGGQTEGNTSYGKTNDALSREALERAFALGITFFDTANVYGDGRSEALIGATFAGMRNRIVIATKAGLSRFDTPPDFSPETLRRSLEDSLDRLKTDRIDLLQLHNPPPELFERSPESYAALEDFKREGMIRCFGMSVKTPAEAITLISRHHVAALQLNFNMLDIRAIDSGLFEIARQQDIGVIARTPLSFGFLSGLVSTATKFPPGDHRRRWPQKQIEHWITGARATHDAAGSLAGQTRSQTALRFCLSFSAVSSVIPGILTPQEAEENAKASDLGPLPDNARDRILALNRATDFFVRD